MFGVYLIKFTFSDVTLFYDSTDVVYEVAGGVANERGFETATNVSIAVVFLLAADAKADVVQSIFAGEVHLI